MTLDRWAEASCMRLSKTKGQAPALESQQPHAALQARGRVDGVRGGKRSGGVSQQPAVCQCQRVPAACPDSQESQRHPGLYQNSVASRTRDVIVPPCVATERPHLE